MKAAPRQVPRALRSRTGVLFTLPAIAIFAVFTIGPTIYTGYISLFHWNLLNTSQNSFLGLDNYRTLFDPSNVPSFWATACTSLYFVGAMVVLGTALSLAIAALLQRAGNGNLLVRLAVFTPHVTPLVATSIVWVWIFNPQFGLANAVLHWLHLPTSDWLLSPDWSMPAVILYTLWHEVGFTVVIFLGGFTTLSAELADAARSDGANAWQQFWYVTWPQLRPVTAFVIVISSISSLQAFTQFYLMTKGGPLQSTTTLSFLLYHEGFVLYHTGFAAALAVVLFAITALLTVINMRLTRASTA